MHGNAEVNGVKYTLVQQDREQHTTLCGGCVARLDNALCRRLPDTCVNDRTIWIKVK